MHTFLIWYQKIEKFLSLTLKFEKTTSKICTASIFFNFLYICITQKNLKRTHHNKCLILVFGPIYDMCGRETEMSLAETGLGASMTIRLTPEDPGNACVLTVTAPKTHLVNVQFVETTSELHRARIFNHTAKNPPCLMTIVSDKWWPIYNAFY